MKRVVLMDLDYNEIKEFNSIKECSKEVNISSSAIVQCCSDKYKSLRTSKFRFKYKD